MTEFINLSEIYLPTAGGSIDGDVEVGGAITVNDGSGAGTSYDVAYEISQLRAENEELKAAWDSVSQSIESLNVKLLDRASGATSLTLTFSDDIFFRTVLLLFGMQNNGIPVFAVIGLQFESGDGAASSSIKNLTEYGVSSATISGRTVVITMNTTNWGALYGLCPSGSFERIWGA